MAKMFSQKYLRSILKYDAGTGIFYWKWRDDQTKAVNMKLAGQVAGTQKEQYWVIRIGGRAYYAHKLAWLYVYGEYPAEIVDHRDLDSLNNRIKNLRKCTPSQNGANSRPRGKSGIKGVSQYRKKWRAQINVMGDVCHLGTFGTPEAASAAYAKAAYEAFGEFSRP